MGCRTIKGSLAIDGLTFDAETHTYTYCGHVLQSATEVVGKFKTPFNADYQAYRMAGTGKYVGMTKGEVLAQWETTRNEAADKGTKVHEWAQDIASVGPSVAVPPDDPDVGYWYQLRQFWTDHGDLRPVALEQIVAMPVWGVAGTFDALARDSAGESYLIDYKTNKEFDLEGYRKLRKPLTFMRESDIDIYSLQLALYEYMLGNVDHKWIVHVEEDAYTVYVASHVDPAHVEAMLTDTRYRYRPS